MSQVDQDLIFERKKNSICATRFVTWCFLGVERARNRTYRYFVPFKVCVLIRSLCNGKILFRRFPCKLYDIRQLIMHVVLTDNDSAQC